MKINLKIRYIRYGKKLVLEIFLDFFFTDFYISYKFDIKTLDLLTKNSWGLIGLNRLQRIHGV